MVKYIIKRLLLSILILLGVSLILYTLIRCMPASFIDQKVAAMNQNGTVSEETIQSMKALYGLEDDSFRGIITGYLRWWGLYPDSSTGGLNGLLQGNFGTSFYYSGRQVIDVIKDNMGVSFAIALIATIFEFLIAVPLGITAATHQYSFRDYCVTILVMIGISLPSFFFGQVLKDLLALKTGWFASSGWLDATQTLSPMEKLLDYVRFAFIPILTVVILSVGSRMRMTRTNMLEVLNSDYIRTARAKGLKERIVIYKHAFRNTLIPLVTSMAGLLPGLFSGAIITEQVFDLPGIGNLAYKAMVAGDIPFIMGYNMFLAILSVIGVLLADLMYAVVDPRVKLQ